MVFIYLLVFCMKAMLLTTDLSLKYISFFFRKEGRTCYEVYALRRYAGTWGSTDVGNRPRSQGYFRALTHQGIPLAFHVRSPAGIRNPVRVGGFPNRPNGMRDCYAVEIAYNNNLQPGSIVQCTIRTFWVRSTKQKKLFWNDVIPSPPRIFF